MATNTIKQLLTEGQSVWQDDISRDMLNSGLLQQRIDEVGIRGVTSNPSIFQKAIASGDAYDADITRLLGDNLAVEDVFQTLAVKDIQDACDLFRRLAATADVVVENFRPGVAERLGVDAQSHLLSNSV